MSKVDIDRVEWEPAPQIVEAFGDLVEMIVGVLTVQDDLRREKDKKPVTGYLETRTPEDLKKGIDTESRELYDAIRNHDRVNQYEEMSDLLMRWARICRTLELDAELIAEIFFVKARVIAENDAAGARERNKVAERAAMEELVLEYEGE